VTFDGGGIPRLRNAYLLPAFRVAEPAFGSIAVVGFPKPSGAFATSSLGVAEVGTGQLACIVEREPSPP